MLTTFIGSDIYLLIGVYINYIIRSCIGISVILCYPAHAEIITDGSMSGKPVNLPGSPYIISDNLGQQRGGNLFHSFSTFNLLRGEEANFSARNDIQNIIARVTGGKSSIDGTITSNSARLWMINPAGWVFSSHSQINVHSAFHLSTADSVLFNNNDYFFAAHSGQSTLTTSEPIGVRFLKPQQTNIKLEDVNFNLEDKFTFSIVAGNVSITDSTIKTLGGRVLIGATLSEGDWYINENGLQPHDILERGLIEIKNEKPSIRPDIELINVGEGKIQLIAHDSSLKNSRLHARTEGSINAGHIELNNTGNLSFDHTGLSADLTGGNDITGENATNNPIGRAGTINIRANNFHMCNESSISTSVMINSDPSFQGHAGLIDININKQLTLSGRNTLIENTIEGKGNSGKISIKSEEFYMFESAAIKASGLTKASNIEIESSKIKIYADAKIESSIFPFLMSDKEAQSGVGGVVKITATDALTLSDSHISTSAINGNGGDIIINSPYLFLTNAQITTSVEGGGQGNGGDINLNNKVLVMNTGFIQANTQADKGNGGNININPDIQIIASRNNLEVDRNNLEVDGNSRYQFAPDSGLNVIQAFSENGDNGQITTASPQLNISGELTPLESELVDINQIAQNACTAANAKQSTLISLSHGGLPESPQQAGNLALNPERLTQLLKVTDAREYNSDIPGSIITDQPNRERLPPLEYPSQQISPDFTLPLAHPTTTPNQSLRFSVKQFHFSGNTVFGDKELQVLAAPYLERPITLDDLETLRQQLTQHYIEHGYNRSAALLPEQVFSEGIIHFQIIEGRLTDIQVKGTGRLNPSYVQNRLQPKADTPLNAQALEERFQQLHNDPLIERMDARLIPGDTLEQNTLEIEVTRARPYQLSLGINNHSTPGIGAEEVRLDGWVHNLSGFGDRLGLSLGLTEGRFNIDTHFTIPLNRYNTLLSLRFANSQASYIAGALKDIKIKNEFRSYDMTLTQPIYRSFKHNLTLSARLSVRRSRNELLAQGFQFEAGAKKDGSSRVSALRLTQEYSHSQPNQIVSFRSTFSIGLNLFKANWHPDNLLNSIDRHPADGDYMAWLGQLQFAQKVLDNGAQIRLRGNVQLTQDRLLSLERFALGGAYSVRGYRENQRVSDMGYSLSAEFHYPLSNTRTFEHVPGTLTAIPFMDYGVTWNQKHSQQRTSLHSVGIGLNWSYKHLDANVFYAHDLNTARDQQTYNLQDSGIHFRLTATLF